MKKLLLFFTLLAGGLAALAWAVLDEQPRAEPGGRITRDDLVWAKHLFEKSVPRARTTDTVQTLELSAEDVNRLLNYAVVVKPVHGVAATLEEGKALLVVSLRVPRNPFGEYLNFSAELSQQESVLVPARMQAGSLPLPAFLARGVLWVAQRWLRQDPDYLALLESMQGVRLSENHLSLDYQWRPELLTLMERKGAEVLVGAEEKQRLLAYAEFVRKAVVRYPDKSQQPLREVLGKVFGHARQRGGDAAAENRAAYTALGAYVAGVSLHQLLEGRGRSTRRAPPVLLTLHGRRDAAEHLLIAAALSANGGSRLANAMGLAKEEEDVQSGSGFSFTDIAYDRAGARLGELGTGPRAAAVQARLAALASDEALAPVFSDLPEFMPEAVFVRRFGAVGSPAYRTQIAEIERRLDRHPLYQQ
ncbi:MAG: hypothetical protein AB1591_05050 [Pseudomonadota bacterium]